MISRTTGTPSWRKSSWGCFQYLITEENLHSHLPFKTLHLLLLTNQCIETTPHTPAAATPQQMHHPSQALTQFHSIQAFMQIQGPQQQPHQFLSPFTKTKRPCNTTTLGDQRTCWCLGVKEVAVPLMEAALRWRRSSKKKWVITTCQVGMIMSIIIV